MSDYFSKLLTVEEIAERVAERAIYRKIVFADFSTTNLIISIVSDIWIGEKTRLYRGHLKAPALVHYDGLNPRAVQRPVHIIQSKGARTGAPFI